MCMKNRTYFVKDVQVIQHTKLSEIIQIFAEHNIPVAMPTNWVQVFFLMFDSGELLDLFTIMTHDHSSL